MIYNCFIVDDEPLAIDVIANYLDKLPNFKVVGAYTEPVEAFMKIKDKSINLLFIDIQMPDLNGLEFVKALKDRPEIIVTTAFREFAVQGFDLSILDYLVKPIPFERFLQSIDKFLDKKRGQADSVKENTNDFIMVRSERKFIKINLQDILYVEGLKDYVKIVLLDKSVLTKQSIGNFEKLLNKNYFFRIHKSYIAAIDKITAYTNNDVEILKYELPIGRAYKKKFIEFMNSSKT
ncbi:LytR/AlgR family response regulator transcription factor [Aureibaculum conchae]|uniref:LytR/AlgR family response regulator transcription factor n=1 Tax=Aureibaculum sp. 2308TA14-22 TaxID=3108392 RepID=UPI0033930B5B